MGKILRDLWILTEDGLTIFSRVINPNMGPQVFGGLISAINSFAEILAEGGMSNFEMSSIRFTLLKNNHFLFVANSSNEVKHKKVLNELKTISKIFFKTYPEEILENIGTNIKKFIDFGNHIADSLEELV